MKLRLTHLLFALVATATVVAAQGEQARTMMEAARKAEVVDGDLNAAIRQYSTIAERYKDNHAIAADALVRLAECYEKLGDVKARTILERVVRDYADQKEAATVARTRLAREQRVAASGAIVLRKVWGNDTPEIAGARNDTHYALSADGRYMTYVDNYNTTLMLRDLASSTDRRLTPGGYRVAPPYFGTYQSTISKDGTQVAFNACTADQTTCEVRVASLKGTVIPVSRRVFAGDDVSYVAPMDWSPDGRWLAVSLLRKDRTAQIGVLGVSDGVLRVLKSIDWRGTTRMFFSPDGQDVAFDPPVNEKTDERDVFVIAADGSREVAAVGHAGRDSVVGWTPDGTHLPFASDRGGAMGLWSQPFLDRKPRGAPGLVKPDIGNVSSLGLTRSGALYLGLRTRSEDAQLMSIDLASGKQTAPSFKPIQRFTGSNSQPAWSPDGKSLAYVSSRGEARVVAIHSTETGELREVKMSPALPYVTGLTWPPDGRALVIRSQDLKGRGGVFRIDAQSGDVAPMFFRPDKEYLSQEWFFWAPDGKTMYYHGAWATIYERDLATDTERVLVSGTEPPTEEGRMGSISLSPDGRWIASRRVDAGGKSAKVMLVPTTGGAPRELLRVTQPESVPNGSMPWTPDGRGILVKKGTSAGTELWLVPVSGEAPRKVDLDVRNIGTIRMHPDGRQIAFDSREFNMEVWVLENFLPSLKAGR